MFYPELAENPVLCEYNQRVYARNWKDFLFTLGMGAIMRGFRRDQRGYVFILALLVMPIFIGYAFIIIDIGRGNNAHGDLQAAADAVALAGAAELDGGPDAIERARAAMANVTNTVSMLARSGSDMEITLVYEDNNGNEFDVAFLTDLPAEDTTPLTTAFINSNRATGGGDAEYVYVRAQSRDLDTAFFNPADLLSPSVPIAASAVATGTSAACDVPPLYICNPFEFDSTGAYQGDLLQTSFANGDLHGRLIRLHPKGNTTESPGNFGYLQVDDGSGNTNAGANNIREYFAGRTNPTCYEAGEVTTKPGAATGIRTGLNTRFDLYEGNFNNTNGKPYLNPAPNVRKGYRPAASGPNLNHCNPTEGDDHLGNDNGVDDFVYGFPDNATMTPPNVPGGVGGGFIGSGDWNVQNYLDEVYGPGVYTAGAITPSFTNSPGDPGVIGPSRYDVYRHEIDNGWNAVPTPVGGELGTPQCGASNNPTPITPIPGTDSRVLVAAIIDCVTQAGQGGGINDYPVNSYGSIFLTRPMISPSSTTLVTLDDGTTFESHDSTIDVEIIDITGFGGNGTLEEFVREEAILVR
ncbi:TadE/TadG family type IV pilus assembly protein [Roseovarius sp.]|uniref:TadE/TadG family type IV pilus assembly protein n=1 Tax=Roseovarius sp. TaxID=1486281 RepID=UPI003A975C41